MVKLTENFIMKLKSVCNISSVISNYVNLKFSGKNKKCCCPFHSEKTPSFVVFEETESFYCFGCGVGGDVITFIEKIENLDYIAAVKFLAKYAGLNIPEENFTDKNDKLRCKILELNKIAAKFYFENLKTPEGKKGLIYFLKERGLSKGTIIKFGLGFALNEWSSLKEHLNKKGYSNEEILKSNLIVKTRNGSFCDKFRNRVIFPIIDLKGDVIAFGARSLSKENLPKYLNSADTLVFKKSFNVFGLNFAKNSRFENVILCEGYLDVLTLHQYGFTNAVATLGTALTKEQVRLLNRHAKEVVLAYDMDVAGRIAAKRAFSLFDEVGIRVRILNFSNAKDPDEFVRKFGARKFKEKLNSAMVMEKFQLEELKKKYDIKDLEQKRRFINDYCRIVAAFKDPIKKEIYVGELCTSLNLDKYVVLNHIKHLTRKILKRREKGFNLFRNGLKKQNIPIKVIKAEEGVLRFLFFNPDKVSLIRSSVKETYFNLKWHEKLFVFLINSIDLKKELNISILHEILTEEEFGDFTKIINSKELYRNMITEFYDFIDVLKKYYEEKNQNVEEMSLKDLEEERKKKAYLKR